jgi:hypothetical protein
MHNLRHKFAWNWTWWSELCLFGSFSKKSAFFILIAFAASTCVYSQTVIRKPQRATPPNLEKDDFQGVFFDKVEEQLVGSPPEAGVMAGATNSSSQSSSGGAASNPGSANDENQNGAGAIWKERISPQSIEDLVKETKLRLDSVITTPAKFSAGAFKDARRNFTLLATLFAVIELYPEKIKWQASAPVARARFSRVAANTKVGSAPAYNEAKLRLDDINSMLKGATLTDPSPSVEIAWTDIADRIPSMQLLEWGFRENLSSKASSEDSFSQNSEEILKFAELIAMLGETLYQPGMTDGDDDEYKALAKKMIDEATKITQAVKLNNPTMAREAAGQIDQACNACHSSYR